MTAKPENSSAKPAAHAAASPHALASHLPQHLLPLPAGAPPHKPTLIHVTHEATEHLGGIGTVLAGLLTAPSYRDAVARSILVAPLFHPDRHVADPRQRIGEHAHAVFYSGPDHHDPLGLGAILRPVEWALGTRIVYGTRTLSSPGQPDATAEVLLFDVSNPDRTRLAALKWLLWEHYHLDSQRYETGWDFEEYCRLADMAYHTLCVLLKPQELPAVVVSHEYMGMITALRCAVDRARFRTVFHAHECTTARRVTENLPAYDSAFYPAMRAAAKRSWSIETVFGDQSDYARHALVSKVHRLDNALAVGPETAEELRFLSAQMNASDIRIAYNGLPAPKVDLTAKKRSRAIVDAWLKATIGYAPDVLLTHVTRPVPSKGLWRDLQVVRNLAHILRAQNKSLAYILLTCGGPVRSPEAVRDMHAKYRWPANHHHGYPDLTGPEGDLYAGIQNLNDHFATVGGDAGTVGTGNQAKALLINQFGFTRDRIGPDLDAAATTTDLRTATDVELGLSTYEPFGIAQLEPLYAGAICLPSSVCGCLGLVKRAMQELNLTDSPLVLPGDFTRPELLPDSARAAVESAANPSDLNPIIRMNDHDRARIEAQVCQELATELARRLPKSDSERAALIEAGQKLVSHMSWDFVARSDFLPGVRAALAK
ncbi:MAG: hypothetical protein IBJ18_10075 [Phycisphaerales bacterium]|nr:hypothetical protein [Phycisphaerales bacterium]